MTEQSHNDPMGESLSALADNRANELELARLLKRSESDPALRDRWGRYQLGRQAMRGDTPATLAPGDFASRVSAALAEEPDVASPPVRAGRWWAGLGRVAVAASVTGAVVIGAQLYRGEVQSTGGNTLANTGAQAPAERTAREESGNSLPVGFGSPMAPVAQPVSAQVGGYQSQQVPRRQVMFEPRQPDVKVSNEQIRVYLNQLLERHTDHAAVNSAQSVLPYARVPLIEDE